MQPASEISLAPVILSTTIFGLVLATIVTYLVNRKRQTSGLARATLFLSIWGLTTVLPLLIAIPTGHLAFRQIKRSGGALKGKLQAGFGLFCGYAVLVVLGIQLGLGVGDIMSTHRNHLREYGNVRAIERAKRAWAAANNKQGEDTPTASDLAPFMPEGQFPPPSIEGETYQINPLKVTATCVRPRPQF